MRLIIVCIASLLALPVPATAQLQVPTLDPQVPDENSTLPLTLNPELETTPAASSASGELSRGLFHRAWNQVQFGVRPTFVDGDVARFERYQDLRSGPVFTDARFSRSDPDGNWLFHGTADNVGYRDQQFWGKYERIGHLVISGLWDQIPQFYSIDTRTPFTTEFSPLLLDDATQLAIQNGQAKLPAWIPLANQFDLREKRNVGNGSVLATPTPNLDLTAAFTSTRHGGQLPWGATFGFSNDVEVPLPYDSRTNDLTTSIEWTNSRSMVRAGYEGSWFNNLEDTLTWDNPLRLTDSATAGPGRGRMALWPTNAAQTISAAGYEKFAGRTQVTGFASYGFWSSNEQLLPFTINSALPQLGLPRPTAQGEAHVLAANLGVVSHPAADWRFSARARTYDWDNLTPRTTITSFVNYDTAVAQSSTGGPELYAPSRTSFDADATWSGYQPLALTVGYTRLNSGYDFRIFDHTAENVFRVTADTVGSDWLVFRAQYDHGHRTGSDFNEDILTEIGEQPALRHYDIADRTQNKFSGQVDAVVGQFWTLSASGGHAKDDFDNSTFGLQDLAAFTLSFAADYQRPNGLGGGALYNYERYTGLQRSRSTSPGQETDPLRDWTVDTKERVNFFSLYAMPPRFWGNSEARISYDFSYAQGNYVYTVVPGGPLPPPSQLPKVFNKLQQLNVDVRHRLTSHWVGTFSYLYEPFRVFDFAFDPSVIDSIAQPSSLVLGYVYRPYTANSAVLGVQYSW